MAGESFTKPKKRNGEPKTPALDPATFDVDEWLSGGVKVTKYVDVYAKPGLQADIDELDSRLRRAVSDPERHMLATQIETLRQEMEASRVGFKFRAIPETDAADLQERYGDDDDLLAGPCHILARQCVAPAGMTPDAFRRLPAIIGDGYFIQTILATAQAAQQGLGVTVPFSSAASRVLNR